MSSDDVVPLKDWNGRGVNQVNAREIADAAWASTDEDRSRAAVAFGGDVKASTASDELECSATRLAMLSLLEYDRARKPEAKRLGIRVTALDKAVQECRLSSGRHMIEALRDPLPWPEPVDGSALLEEIVTSIKSHVILATEAHSYAMALWVLFAHAHDCFHFSPMLAFSSPTPGCGKTTCLDLIQGMVPRPLSSSNVTPASIFRTIECYKPTLLVDEADTFLPNSSELRGILNSGHRRNSAVVLRTTGENFEPAAFSTWCPKAIALIGKLPPTLADRSIPIRLQKKRPDEQIVRLRFNKMGHLHVLCRMAARWVSDNAAQIASLDPELPNELVNRSADNWLPLIAIADVLGGAWPRRARVSACEMHGHVNSTTSGVLLLEDIYSCFKERDVDRVFTSHLIIYLVELEGRPWTEWRDGKKITARQVAQLLEPFDISPRTIRSISGDTAKGYMADTFKDAFERYVTPT